MFGKYREGQNKFLPHVLHISIARYSKDLPEVDEALQFLVSIHEEGTGITWQQNVTVDPKDERYLLDVTQELYLWSLNAALTPKQAQERVRQLGARLYEIFIGQQGEKMLSTIPPTAVLLNIDETILNLPWELLGTGGHTIAMKTPFGRLITTRIIPKPGRDPLKEDDVVRILAVANPTLDLAAGEREIVALRELDRDRSGNGYAIKVDVLTREKATLSAFSEMLTTGDYDILHFSGHGSFDPSTPETSAIRFADGILSADDILDLSWKAPPYLVFNSACESGRAAGGKRLVSNESHTNGLAAAFIAAGVSAYAGYFWPVTENGAELFAKKFYYSLFRRENVGIAFLEARNYVTSQLPVKVGDLTNNSAILFGDSASEHRLDLAIKK
jgi:hypothetical protein